MSRPDLAALQRAAETAGRRCCVGAVIFDADQRVFVPRRASDATNLPGLWDIVGGHVEPGESFGEALRREVFEETGWTVVGTPRLSHVAEWTPPNEPDAPRREFDFVVTVDGDLAAAPRARRTRRVPLDHA